MLGEKNTAVWVDKTHAFPFEKLERVCVYFALLGTEPKASDILAKHSATDHPLPPKGNF